MMLNFGIFAVPLAYGAWGFGVGRFRRYVQALPPADLRLLFVPYFIWFIPNMILWDLDNWLAHSLNRAIFPIVVIWLLSDKLRRSSTRTYRNIHRRLKTNG
jgi:hypothetical protein